MKFLVSYPMGDNATWQLLPTVYPTLEFASHEAAYLHGSVIAADAGGLTVIEPNARNQRPLLPDAELEKLGEHATKVYRALCAAADHIDNARHALHRVPRSLLDDRDDAVIVTFLDQLYCMQRAIDGVTASMSASVDEPST